MSDFASDFGSGLKNDLVPGKGALNRKVDNNREKFIKGISNTKFGKKEGCYFHKTY